MLDPQTVRDKQLLAWDREMQTLEKRLRNPPSLPLDKPIQQGWRRQFTLSEAARLRPDAAVLAAILEEINTVAHHWRRDFLPSRRQRSLTRRAAYSGEQLLRAIDFNEWDRRQHPDAWLSYFRRELVLHAATLRSFNETYSRRWLHVYSWLHPHGYITAQVFRYPRFFTLKTERHWLTHLRQHEPEVERRCAELAGYLAHHGGTHRLDWLYGYSRRHWKARNPRAKILRRLAEREMRAALGPLRQTESPGVADAVPPVPPCAALAARRRPPIFFPHLTNPTRPMKLAKALKQKNLLAGEVALLKSTLAEQNSRSARQPFDYDARTVLARLRAKADELANLKARLAVANANAYPQIFRLAELKGLVAALKVLPTKDGVFTESLGYAQNAEVAYVAQIKRAEVDALVESLQTEIQALQDALDEYNFTRSIADA